MNSKKVTVIGAGNVGATIAFILASNGMCHDICIKDIKVEATRARALDIGQAVQALRMHSSIKEIHSAEEMAGSDVIVVTAGSPRREGMSRDDLLLTNARIMQSVAREIKEYAPHAIVIVVSNPLDAMVYTFLKTSGFDKRQVIGMAGILDSSRMAAFICEKLGYASGQINASVMGGHGDDMVPLTRYTTVGGVCVEELLTKQELDEIVERTRNGGAEIVGLLGTSAYYAPAASIAVMVEAILGDSKQVFPCAVYLEGEYGYTNIVSGVPIVIGSHGVESIVELKLNDAERSAFAKSIASVKSLTDTLDRSELF